MAIDKCLEGVKTLRPKAVFFRKGHFWHEIFAIDEGFNIKQLLEKEVSGIFCFVSRVDWVLPLALQPRDISKIET